MDNKIEEDNDFFIKKGDNFDFNELVEKIGYQSIQFTTILSCFILIVIEGSSFTFMSTFLIPLEKYFAFDKFMILVLSSIIFIGVGIGSISIGLLVPYFSRIDLIRFNVISFLIFSTLLIFSSNIYLFTIIRFISGINIGVFIPIMINILCEVLPIRLRSFFMLFIWSGFGLGQLFNFIFTLLFNKNFEPEKIPSILIALAIFYILLGVPCLFLIKESYRNLITKGHEKEAFDVLKELLENRNIELTEDLKVKIRESIKSSDNKEFTSDFKSLFSEKHFFISIVSSFIFAICSALFYGPLLIYSKTLNDLNISDNEDIIVTGIITSILGPIFLILVAIISENGYVGLKTLSLILFTISWCFTFAIIIWTDKIKYLLILYFGITNSSFNSITTMISLLYPTIIRDLAVGYLYSCIRFGGFISQFVFLGTYEIGIKIPYIILCVLNATLIVLIFLIKTDSTKIPLDHSFEIDNRMKNIDEHNQDNDIKDNEYEKSLNKTS